MILRFFFIAYLLGLFSTKVLGQSNILSPSKPIGKYILDHWTTEDGLPANALINIVQTSDGYLWVSSYNGLIRFDGLTFRLFNKENVPAFKSNPISVIYETSQKELLIGAENSGILRLHKSKFDVLLSHSQINAPIQVILEGQQQKLWLGTQGKGLWIFDRKTNEVQVVSGHQLLEKTTINALAFDDKQGVWIGVEKGLLIQRNGKTEVYNKTSGLFDDNVITFLKTKDGRMWVGTGAGLNYWNGTTFIKVPETENFPIRSLVQDEAGSLWISTQKGLFRYHEGYKKLEFFTDKDGLPHPDIRSMLIDHEQSLWLTTYRFGLMRFKNGKFTNYTSRDGLASPVANHICEWQPNKFLVGTDVGTVNLIDSGKVKAFPFKTVLPNDKRIKHILKDSKGNLWLSTYSGLLKIEPNGNEKLFTTKDGLAYIQVRLAFEAKDGTLWVGTRGGGIIGLRNGIFKAYNKRNGFPSDFIMSIAEDKDGNIMVGTNESGLVIMDRVGNIEKQYTMNDGLSSSLVFNTHIDREGILWTASNNGFSRIDRQNNKITSFSIKDGLPDENIFDIKEDNFDNFWFASGKGILKIAKNTLDTYNKNNQKELNFIVYDKHDGMAQSECTGATSSLRAANGALYFPNLGGVVMINPQDIPTNNVKPPVYTEDVTIDYDHYDMTDSVLRIEAGKQRFVIDYTALSYIAPLKIKFKYKLEGFDKQWLDAHGERKAVYTNIAPGNYKFRVIASNNDGLWNDKGATLNIRVMPYFWQTLWFWVLASITIGLIIWAIASWQLRKIKNKNVELEKMVEVRTVEIRRKSDEILLKNTALEQQKEEILSQQEIIAQSTNKLRLAFTEIQNKNLNITASIQYAKRIQDAMLPLEAHINQYLPESFVYFQPRDIVSGDFYWFAVVRNEQTQVIDKLVIAAADCTGHGVPGAFMAMAGNAYLNQIVNIQNITDTGNILSLLHLSIRNALKQGDSDNHDGMDIALCCINLQAQEIHFSGAQNPLIYIQEQENGSTQLTEVKGDKFPIGGNWGKNNDERAFTTHIVNFANKKTTCYLFSDGYADQFGGELNKKFSKKRLLEKLQNIHALPLKEQKEILEQNMKNWKGNSQQLDDILVMGFVV
jgi:ligand-binding sensor domain-containing protein/serine phosphatase RsbU (regulator of sigma subunit)